MNCLKMRLNILENALKYISQSNFTTEDISLKFKGLLKDYEFLLKTTQKLSKISDAQGKN